MCDLPQEIADGDLCDMLLVRDELSGWDTDFWIVADRQVAIIFFGFDNVERAFDICYSKFLTNFFSLHISWFCFSTVADRV